MAKKTLTIEQGVPVTDNLNSFTARRRGPVLFPDWPADRETGAFDSERTPQRVVHVKRAGANGYFPVPKNMVEYTKVKFLQEMTL